MGPIFRQVFLQENRFFSRRICEEKSRMSRIPSLNSLRVFEAAARLQSFVRASEELHVTHGAVSRQIKGLEEALGVPLFVRRNRAVFLTPAGESLLAAAGQALALVSDAVERIQRTSNTDVLVVSCEPTIAMKWLIPRLASFHEEHPDVLVHLMTAGGPIDFARSGVDVALRRNDFRWDIGLNAAHVCDEHVGPVCASRLVAPSGGVVEAPRLISRSRSEGGWKLWENARGMRLASASETSYEHFYLCIQAAGAGLGVALASALMVADDLGEGRLSAPYGFVADGSAYYLLSPGEFQDGSKLSKFLSWLRTETAGTLADVSKRSG